MAVYVNDSVADYTFTVLQSPKSQTNKLPEVVLNKHSAG